MIKERGKCPFGFPFYQWNPMAYPGSKSLPPVICRSFTGRSFRSLEFSAIRGAYLDNLSGPIDAPDKLPGGSHLGENVTCDGKPIMRKAQLIYAREVSR